MHEEILTARLQLESRASYLGIKCVNLVVANEDVLVVSNLVEHDLELAPVANDRQITTKSWSLPGLKTLQCFAASKFRSQEVI